MRFFHIKSNSQDREDGHRGLTQKLVVPYRLLDSKDLSGLSFTPLGVNNMTNRTVCLKFLFQALNVQKSCKTFNYLPVLQFTFSVRVTGFVLSTETPFLKSYIICALPSRITGINNTVFCINKICTTEETQLNIKALKFMFSVFQFKIVQ